MRIRLEGLHKTYPLSPSRSRAAGAGTGGAAIEALRGVTLDIPQNSIFGVIGKSGAGQSTLHRLASLLETPESGAVFYGGERVDSLASGEMIQKRRRNGMIFQNFNLFSSRTAGGNIAYPLEICGKSRDEIAARTAELLGLVELSDRGASPVSALSGGQKQRIAIARALANNPDILFCDEATSALDPQTTRSILALIRRLQRTLGITVLMITHQMEVVRETCDYVAVLDKGRITETGSVREVFAAPASEVTRDFLRTLGPAEPEGARDGR
jgi:D-methionine transport system ATP-binding protein